LIAGDPQVAAVRAACGQIAAIAVAARAGTTMPGAAVSYSVDFAADSRQGFASLLATVESLLMILKPTAMVRTASDEETIETLVRYTGSANSVSTVNLSAYMAQIHSGSVERTYALRNAVVGAFVAAASTLMTLSASAANPLLLLRALSTARSLEEALRRLASAIETAA
jgi:hypothetical protein